MLDLGQVSVIGAAILAADRNSPSDNIFGTNQKTG